MEPGTFVSECVCYRRLMHGVNQHAKPFHYLYGVNRACGQSCSRGVEEREFELNVKQKAESLNRIKALRFKLSSVANRMLWHHAQNDLCANHRRRAYFVIIRSGRSKRSCGPAGRMRCPAYLLSRNPRQF